MQRPKSLAASISGVIHGPIHGTIYGDDLVDVQLDLTGADTAAPGQIYTLTIAASGDDVGGVTGYTVDFGDGSGPQAAVLGANTHTYTVHDIGRVITVTALHPEGNRQAQRAITVLAADITVTATGAANIIVGEPYALTIGATGADAGLITTYDIDYGDGTVVTGVAAGVHNHTYTAQPHTRNIVVTANHSYGATDSAPKSVDVLPIDLAVTGSGAATSNEGSLYSLTIATSGASAGSIDDIDIDWGDGSAIEMVAGPGVYTHTYADDGTPTIDVTANHQYGSANDTLPITVSNVAPTATLTGGDATVDALYTVNIGSVTDPGADTISNFRVHWGDGSFDDYATAGDKTHTYTAASASLDITLDITDEDGTHVAVDTLTIAVNAAITVLFEEDFSVDASDPLDGNVIDVDFTHSRTSDRTVINGNGTLEIIPAGALAIDNLDPVYNLLASSDLSGFSAVGSTSIDDNTTATFSATSGANRVNTTAGFSSGGKPHSARFRITPDKDCTIRAWNLWGSTQDFALTAGVPADLEFNWTDTDPAHSQFLSFHVEVATGGLPVVATIEDIQAEPSATSGPFTSVGVGTGAELVTNGTFDTSDNWTIAGGGSSWIISGGVCAHTPGSTNALYQVDVADYVGQAVEISYEVTGRTVGSVRCDIGGTLGTLFASNGPFSEPKTVTGNTTLYFYPSSDFDGAIDNVSVKQCNPGRTGKDGFAYDDRGGVLTNGALSVQPGATRLNSNLNDYSANWTFDNLIETPNASSIYTIDRFASKLFEGATNSRHIGYATAGAALGQHVVSALVEGGERRYVFIQIASGSGVADRTTILIDTQTSTIVDTATGTGTPTGVSYGCYEYSPGLTFAWVSQNNTSGTVYPVIGLSDSASPTYNTTAEPVYIGDGSSGAYFHAVQVETGSVPTAFIKGNGATASRTAQTGPDYSGHSLYQADNETRIIAKGIGADQVTNGDFSSAVGWTQAAGTTVGSGVAYTYS